MLVGVTGAGFSVFSVASFMGGVDPAPDGCVGAGLFSTGAESASVRCFEGAVTGAAGALGLGAAGP